MSKRRLVGVGNDMGGARFVEELVSRGGRHLFETALYRDEPYGAYRIAGAILIGDAAAIPRLPQAFHEEAVLAGARGLRAIRHRTRALSGCGPCTPEVQEIVDFACGVLPYVGAGTHGHGRA
jgi:NAD(P)H-nitrite reductase large subunit